MRAVVTAGGTSEPIDDVRVVTNLSSGRFGAAVANALAARGVDVTLLAGRALAGHPEWVDPRVRIVRFGSFAELDAALTAAITPPPALLFMAAAVSDYSPVRSAGKIRSDADELTIVMRRNPKLLGALRARCGVGTFLVGFKLLSGVSRDDLVATARGQLRRDHLNLCVANDLQELGGDAHPVVLVTPEGGELPRAGTKAEVAAALVDFALRRAATRWHRSERGSVSEPPGGRDGAAALLALAIDGGLLPGTDGNVSHRAGDGLVVTPRQVPKAALTRAELVYAEVAGGIVRYDADRKPSIDAAVHAWLYRQIPALQGLLHFHDALVAPTATTPFPWPCGSTEEAEEIGRALLAAGSRGGSFAVRLVDHGWLVGTEDAAALAARWGAARAGYAEHLREIGLDPGVARPGPVFDGGELVGVCAEVPHGWSTWLLPELRGGGRGDRVVDALDARGRSAVVGDACGVAEWYRERGWVEVAREGPFVRLDPPSRRTGWIEAASVCLVDPHGRVLLGQRAGGPWPGHWAFPGGRRDPGDAGLLATALRELREETGIALEWAPVARERTVYVGDYAVQNFVVRVLGAPEPRPSAEMTARWVHLEEARQLRPMAAGTRRVLRGLGG